MNKKFNKYYIYYNYNISNQLLAKNNKAFWGHFSHL